MYDYIIICYHLFVKIAIETEIKCVERLSRPAMLTWALSMLLKEKGKHTVGLSLRQPILPHAI